MKFYIVDNGSKYLEHIIHRVTDAGHEYCVQTYSPFKKLNDQDADMIILSGGMQNEVADDLDNGDPWYRYEFELIETTNKPILGICLGLQMIAVALGGTLRKLPHLIATDTKLANLTKDGQQLLGANAYTVHEKHQWIVDNYSGTGLTMLADSEDGVEILYHAKKRIIATQFHPEIDVNPESKDIFWSLVEAVAKPVRIAHVS